MDDVLALDDIQGLVARGYGKLRFACFLPMAVRDAGAARRALSDWARQVTTAGDTTGSETMNIALTASGVRAVTEWRALPDGFSYPFQDGMTSEYRSRFLGDLDADAPEHWRWGGPSTATVHLLLLLYGVSAEKVRRRTEAIIRKANRSGLDVLARLECDELSHQEPFGFADGISQPALAGLPSTSGAPDAVRAGEFVLGYRNEYGERTQRPSVPVSADPAGLLDRDEHGRADLGRNGSYLVLRQLEQDVDGFWRYVESQSRLADGTTDSLRRDHMAAKIVGRWRSGAPLVLAPTRDDPGLAGDNDFRYRADPDGIACPIGAHIRRVNPRDGLEPRTGPDRSLEVDRRHRLLRRSRGYGNTATEGPSEGRGTYFMCLNANLARQYEFIQHSWINNPVFNGRYDETDPLVGTRHTGGDTFTEPARPVRRRHRGLPQFVTVRGGAYFFLPGLSALRYLTGSTVQKGL